MSAFSVPRAGAHRAPGQLSRRARIRLRVLVACTPGLRPATSSSSRVWASLPTRPPGWPEPGPRLPAGPGSGVLFQGRCRTPTSCLCLANAGGAGPVCSPSPQTLRFLITAPPPGHQGEVGLPRAGSWGCSPWSSLDTRPILTPAPLWTPGPGGLSGPRARALCSCGPGRFLL